MKEFEEVNSISLAWASPKPRRLLPQNEWVTFSLMFGFAFLGLAAFYVLASPLTTLFCFALGAMFSMKSNVGSLATRAAATFAVFILAEIFAHALAIVDLVWVMIVLVIAALVFIWGFWK